MPNIRKANENDSRDIFEWRNDELTRQMSHTTDLVEWGGHSARFAASLANTKCLLVICEDESTDEKVAIVRFDIEDERALISINLSPKMRGKGKAKGCLKDAIFFFKKYSSFSFCIPRTISFINNWIICSNIFSFFNMLYKNIQNIFIT